MDSTNEKEDDRYEVRNSVFIPCCCLFHVFGYVLLIMVHKKCFSVFLRENNAAAVPKVEVKMGKSKVIVSIINYNTLFGMWL